jgi:hypothetical protein
MSHATTEVSSIKGNRIRFIQTSLESGHSNFLFIRDFLRQKHVDPYIPSLIRVLSLARKLDFKGMLVDQIPCEESTVLREENRARFTKQNFGETGNIPRRIDQA